MPAMHVSVAAVAWFGWILAACACASVVQAAPARERPVVAITDVSVVDVEQGRAVGPRTVLVVDGRIVAIGAQTEVHVPADAQRVDGRGRFLIPGLVDMHVHLFNNASRRPPNTWAFALFVANGVTAVREMAAEPASIATVDEWREAMARGDLVAPRVLAAGVVVRGTSPDDAAHRVDAAADAGADFIKVFSEVPEANWRAILDEARRRSLPVIGHVPAGVSLLTAAAAGQRSNEHLMQAFEACTTIEQSMLDNRRGLDSEQLVARRDAEEARVLDAYDQDTCDRVATALAATGQVQVPTLVLAFTESKLDPRSPETDSRWRYLRPDERARWLRILAGVTPQDRAVAARRWTVAREITSTFHRAGVPVLAGTDTPMPRVYPGFSLHEELEHLVESGMSPQAALRAATLAPASFLGISDTAGSVAVGKRADLVILDADPLSDIHNTRRIHAVLLDGRLLTRSALDALLAKAENTAGSAH